MGTQSQRHRWCERPDESWTWMCFHLTEEWKFCHWLRNQPISCHLNAIASLWSWCEWREKKKNLRDEFAEINFSLKLMQFNSILLADFFSHSEPWDEHTSYSQYLNLLTKCANKRNIISIPRHSHYYFCVSEKRNLFCVHVFIHKIDPLLVCSI